MKSDKERERVIRQRDKERNGGCDKERVEATGRSAGVNSDKESDKE